VAFRVAFRVAVARSVDILLEELAGKVIVATSFIHMHFFPGLELE